MRTLTSVVWLCPSVVVVVVFNAAVCLLKHLHGKGRKDDLLGDPCYQRFGEELNQVLKDWRPSVLPDGRCCGIVALPTTFAPPSPVLPVSMCLVLAGAVQ